MTLDPLTAAGRATCRYCGARSYPLDALWLDDASVLARFPSCCEHSDEQLHIVTVSPPRCDRDDHARRPTDRRGGAR